MIYQRLKQFKTLFRKGDSITLRYEDILKILKAIDELKRDKKSKFLKNNPNSRGIRRDYWTEEKVKEVNESIKDLSKRIVDIKDSDEYAIIVNGKKLNIYYEEMCELLTAMNTCALGNEAFIAAKLKADYMRKFLPTTNY